MILTHRTLASVMPSVIAKMTANGTIKTVSWLNDITALIACNDGSAVLLIGDKVPSWQI